MRLLIVGDSHGDLNFMTQMIHKAMVNDIKTIIQLGDFGFVWNDIGDLYNTNAKKLSMLNDAAAMAGVEILFLPGNHEDWDMLEALQGANWMFPDTRVDTNIIYLGKVNEFMMGDVTFATVGGAYSIDRGWRVLNESWWQQEELADDDIDYVRTLYSPVDVLLTHDAPTWQQLNIMPIVESHIHRQRMNQVHDHLKPKLWLHGHYHQFVDWTDHDTRVVGLSCNGEWEPNYVILDTNTLELTFDGVS